MRKRRLLILLIILAIVSFPFAMYVAVFLLVPDQFNAAVYQEIRIGMTKGDVLYVIGVDPGDYGRGYVDTEITEHYEGCDKLVARRFRWAGQRKEIIVDFDVNGLVMGKWLMAIERSSRDRFDLFNLILLKVRE